MVGRGKEWIAMESNNTERERERDMYTCMYTYIYMYVFFTCIYVLCIPCIHVYMCIYVYMYICIHVYMYTFMHECICDDTVWSRERVGGGHEMAEEEEGWWANRIEKGTVV